MSAEANNVRQEHSNNLCTIHGSVLRLKILGVCLTTVLMEYKSPTFNSFEKCTKMFLLSLITVVIWGGSRGGSGGSVEPPKLNVKMYNKRVVKKKVNQLS